MKTAVLRERLPELTSPVDSIIFVVDSSFVPVSLGECIQRLGSRYPQSRFVVVSRASTKEDDMTMLRLGAHGIVEDRKVASNLRDAVQAVAKGRLWVSDEVLQTYVESEQSRSASRNKSAFRITRREAQVVELAKLRLSNKEIATTLGVQESTVKYHLSNVFDKLRVQNRHDLGTRPEALRLWSQILSA